MEERWLIVDEVASCLKVKRDLAYKWISKQQTLGREIG